MSRDIGRRPMRIVLVQRTLHPNTFGWIEGLRERGHDVRIVTRGEKSNVDHDRDDIVIVADHRRTTRLLARILRPSNKHRYAIPRPLVMWRALRAIAPDAVLIKSQDLRAIVVSVMALLLRIRRVSWSNQTREEDRGWRWLRTIGIMPRRHIRTVPTGIGVLGKPDDHGTNRAIPYAVALPDTPSAKMPKGHPTDNPPVRILTVAAYKRERKRAWWTLAAAEQAGILDGRATFTFVGTGRDHAPGLVELRKRAHHHADHVAIHLNVPYEQMASIYARHDVLVLPSRNEPFGMVVLEAMAHGLAVIVSDTTGSKSCVIPGETGLIFPSDDLAALGDALAQLVDEPELVASMGTRGRQFVARHASPGASAEAIEALIRR